MLTNKGIGGNEVPLDASEAIFEIPQNRTLFAQKLTADDPVKPELVEGLTTVEKVFEHYKPEVKVDFESYLVNQSEGKKEASILIRSVEDFDDYSRETSFHYIYAIYIKDLKI